MAWLQKLGVILLGFFGMIWVVVILLPLKPEPLFHGGFHPKKD